MTSTALASRTITSVLLGLFLLLASSDARSEGKWSPSGIIFLDPSSPECKGFASKLGKRSPAWFGQIQADERQPLRDIWVFAVRGSLSNSGGVGFSDELVAETRSTKEGLFSLPPPAGLTGLSFSGPQLSAEGIILETGRDVCLRVIMSRKRSTDTSGP
jgi:hypothetical protein